MSDSGQQDYSKYEEAAAQRHVETMTGILKAVHLDEETIEANLQFDLDKE